MCVRVAAPQVDTVDIRRIWFDFPKACFDTEDSVEARTRRHRHLSMGAVHMRVRDERA